MGGGPSTPALAAAVSGAGGLGVRGRGLPALGRLRDGLARGQIVLPGAAPSGSTFRPAGACRAPADVVAYTEALRGEPAPHAPRSVCPARTTTAGAEARAALRRAGRSSRSRSAARAGGVARLHDAGTPSGSRSPPSPKPARPRGRRRRGRRAGLEAGGHRGTSTTARPATSACSACCSSARCVGDDSRSWRRAGSHRPRRRRRPGGGRRGSTTGHGVHALSRGGDRVRAPRAIARAEAQTALTRAFTGRTARGIVNRFLREHSADAPALIPKSTT